MKTATMTHVYWVEKHPESRELTWVRCPADPEHHEEIEFLGAVHPETGRFAGKWLETHFCHAGETAALEQLALANTPELVRRYLRRLQSGQGFEVWLPKTWGKRLSPEQSRWYGTDPCWDYLIPKRSFSKAVAAAGVAHDFLSLETVFHGSMTHGGHLRAYVPTAALWEE